MAEKTYANLDNLGNAHPDLGDQNAHHDLGSCNLGFSNDLYEDSPFQASGILRTAAVTQPVLPARAVVIDNGNTHRLTQASSGADNDLCYEVNEDSAARVSSSCEMYSHVNNAQARGKVEHKVKHDTYVRADPEDAPPPVKHSSGKEPGYINVQSNQGQTAKGEDEAKPPNRHQGSAGARSHGLSDAYVIMHTPETKSDYANLNSVRSSGSDDDGTSDYIIVPSTKKDILKSHKPKNQESDGIECQTSANNACDKSKQSSIKEPFSDIINPDKFLHSYKDVDARHDDVKPDDVTLDDVTSETSSLEPKSEVINLPLPAPSSRSRRHVCVISVVIVVIVIIAGIGVGLYFGLRESGEGQVTMATCITDFTGTTAGSSETSSHATDLPELTSYSDVTMTTPF